MTVLDVFLDRPRVVPEQQVPAGSRKRYPSTGETQQMQEIQGCIVGNILPSAQSTLFSMDGNDGSPEPESNTRLLRENDESNGSSPQSKKQKFSVKTSRTPVRNRRKSRWKLKFHHQALPPEYLRHYKQQERKRKQTETGKYSQTNSQSKKLVKKSASTDDRKTVSENTKINEDMVTTEVTGVKVEDSVRSEETGDNVEGLNPTPPTTPVSRPISALERSQPRSEVEPSRPYKSTDELLQSGFTGLPLNIDVSQNKAFLENLLTNQIEINRVVQKERRLPAVKTSLSQFNRLKNVKHEERQKSYSIPPSGKIMKYSDLPYMGEITLDGIKPRRGRKPKKADICHLIYKNYGQVFPGAPEKEVDDESARKHLKWRPEVSKSNSSQRTKGAGETGPPDRLNSPLPSVSGLLNHSEVQNRIINSLLEKRLTQEMKLKSGQVKEREEGNRTPRVADGEEPLNLCVRDLQSLKIKLSRKDGNVYEAKQRKMEIKDNIKTEEEGLRGTEVVPIDRSEWDVESTDENDEEDDLAPFNLVTTELRESSDDENNYLNLGDQITLTRVTSPSKKQDERTQETQGSGDSPPMIFWSGSGLLVPGMPPSPLMYYPKLPDLMTPNFNFNKQEGLSATSPDHKFSRSKSESGRSQLKRNTSTNSCATSKSPHSITKRKRSAIFIPPVPAESTTNPTTEVSICKFKFTGGAKPSLQEKKMLSVDSGGNFRYYSGTGDKSMRGYEYFPRESLQQCQENTGCSPSGVFLTASALGSGEKIPEEIGHSGFFDSDFPLSVANQKGSDHKIKSKTKSKQRTEVDEKRMPEMTCYRTLREHLLASKPESAPDLGLVPEEDGNSSDQSSEFDLRGLSQGYFDSFKMHDETGRMCNKNTEASSRNRKLRKTRKSLAREKLEQTFKEKGFLIQTQQLESAEGATYCKFRQLRKFTRYLFRSWKDYLPGNVRNLSVDAGVDNPEMMMVNHMPDVSLKTEAAERLNDSPD
ncbi:hypothetical protein RUM43_012535 [Polyplax serrata]|uniref:Uncharacterized protein n=1 Tax=Polyplax serrata TaxID=468196 RepID=A0AAN8NXF4_POLSC